MKINATLDFISKTDKVHTWPIVQECGPRYICVFNNCTGETVPELLIFKIHI
jgi:hypothetical protein